MGIRVVADVRVIDIEKRRHPSKHYVYVISITWSDGTVTVVYRRYSRFFELQSKLLDKFEEEAGAHDPADRIVPFLPGKILLGRSHIEKVARKRLQPIDAYCKTLIKLPSKISECDEVLQFFESTPEDINPKLASESKKEQTCESISEPMLLEQYVAVADYIKQAKKEVSLKAGQAVEVIEKNETGWWLVSVDDEQGWVPASYLERSDGIEEDTMIETLPGDDSQYICLDDFIPENADEVQLDKGAMVDVVQKSLDGWWRVRFKGKEGWAPAAYLTQISADRAAIITSQATKSPPNPDVERIRKSPNESPPGSRKNSFLESAKFPLPSLDKVASIMKKLSPMHSPEGRRKSSVDSEQPTGGVEIIKTMMEVSTLPVKKPGEEGEGSPQRSSSPVVMAPADRMKDAVFKRPSGGQMSSPGSGKAPPRRGSISENTKKRLKVPPKRPEPPKFKKEYYTIADFNDSAEDGIDFKAGQKVEILERNSSGWWFVKIHDKEGWAPASYIEEKQVPAAIQDTNRALPKLPSSPATERNTAQNPVVPAAPLAPPIGNSVTSARSASSPPAKVTPTPPAPPPGGVQQAINAALRRVPSDSEESDSDFDNDFDDEIASVDTTQTKPAAPPAQNVAAISVSVDIDKIGPDSKPELYIACASYEKFEDIEISFNEDDVVEVLEKASDGWWLIRKGDEEGWAPESYLVKFDEDDDFDATITTATSKSDSPSQNQDKPTKEKNSAPGKVGFPLRPESNTVKTNFSPLSPPKLSSKHPVPSIPVKPQAAPKPLTTRPKPMSKPSVVPKPKSDTGRPVPRLPSKPVTQKPQVLPQKESITKSKVSNLSNMFSSGQVDESQREPSPIVPNLKTSGRVNKVSGSDEQFGQPVTCPKPFPKPGQSKTPANNSSPSPFAANLKPVKPKPEGQPAKSPQISAKPKPVMQMKPKFGDVKDSGNIEGELGAILSRRKNVADSTNGGVPTGRQVERADSEKGSSVKELQNRFNQKR